MVTGESCLSDATDEELDVAILRDLVRGDGGGDQCDFACENVGACGDSVADIGESTRSMLW